MKLVQFFLLSIERNMISNKNGFDIFYTAFREACGEGNDILDNTKFYYAIVLLSKALFYNDDNPFETMFNQMLVDNLMTSDMKSKLITMLVTVTCIVVGGRVPYTDDDTMEVLKEEAIVVYLTYYEQLKQLFTNFVHPNYNSGRKVPTSPPYPDSLIGAPMEGHRGEKHPDGL